MSANAVVFVATILVAGISSASWADESNDPRYPFLEHTQQTQVQAALSTYDSVVIHARVKPFTAQERAFFERPTANIANE